MPGFGGFGGPPGGYDPRWDVLDPWMQEILVRDDPRYISDTDSSVHTRQEDAIARGLSTEASAGTGAGCSQSPENVRRGAR